MLSTNSKRGRFSARKIAASDAEGAAADGYRLEGRAAGY